MRPGSRTARWVRRGRAAAMGQPQGKWRRAGVVAALCGLLGAAAAAWLVWPGAAQPQPAEEVAAVTYEPRKAVNLGGFLDVSRNLRPWPPDATLEEISQVWR